MRLCDLTGENHICVVFTPHGILVHVLLLSFFSFFLYFISFPFPFICVLRLVNFHFFFAASFFLTSSGFMMGLRFGVFDLAGCAFERGYYLEHLSLLLEHGLGEV